MRRTNALLAGAAGMLAAATFSVGAANAGADRSELCHWDSDAGEYVLLSLPSQAIEQHLAHHDEDGIPGEDLAEDCGPAAQAVFARAYSTTPTGDEVLIAQIVDTNDSGVLDAGDTVETNQYPRNHDATDFGDFAVTSHTVTGIGTAAPESVVVFASGDEFFFGASDFDDLYIERSELGAHSDLVDAANQFVGDRVDLNISGSGALSPSEPVESGQLFQMENPTDDPFLDVEIAL